MKIIDFEKNGSQVRFYLGKNNLKDWCGDDWDDTPYEHNAGRVYDEFVSTTEVVTFGFDDLVLEPSDGQRNSIWCKEDMKKRKVPCIIVVPAKIARNSYETDFDYWNCSEEVRRFYFGDKL